MSVPTLPLVPETPKVSGTGASAETVPTLFLLGTHHPGWLSKTHLDGPDSTAVPLFISDRRLRGYRRLPQAVAPWALDSGGFTELASHGTWDNGPTPAQYAARIRRYRNHIGQLLWAAPQDWMCEPWIIAKTGLTVRQHQQRTVANFLELREIAPDLPIIPVVQGWTVADYLHAVDMYDRAGVDLTATPLVGVGSICRRQDTTEAGCILAALHIRGVTRLHGFGFKVLGLRRYATLLTSADSMAWSVAARRRPPLLGCTTHINCANCSRYAYRWRQHVLTTCATASPAVVQPALFHLGAGKVA